MNKIWTSQGACEAWLKRRDGLASIILDAVINIQAVQLDAVIPMIRENRVSVDKP
jgi:hypothetical protein